MGRLWSRGAVGLLCAVFLAGCPGEPEPEGCAADAVEACACPGGGEGERTCGADGAFGACECPECLTTCDPAQECGEIDDGCGGVLSCGACGEDATCQPDLTCACDEGFEPDGELCVPEGCAGEPDVDAACGEVEAECGEIVDDCGREVDCGGCGEDETCGDDLICACAAGFVDLGLGCVDDACDPDPCAADERCVNTLAGATCECAAGLTRVASGDCLLDLADVGDVSSRPVSLVVDGVGTFSVRQLSAVGMAWEIQRVTVGSSDLPVYDQRKNTPVIAGGITGSAADLAALRAAIAAGTARNVRMRLNGVAGQWVDLTSTSAAGTTLSFAQDVAVDVGGATGLGAIRIDSPWWDIADFQDIPTMLRPRPLPGVSVEVDSVFGGEWVFAPGVADVRPADRAVTLPGVPDLFESLIWFSEANGAWEASGQTDHRAASFIELDASGREVGRRTAGGTLPTALWYFDPSRPYGAGPLLTLELAFGSVQDGACPVGLLELDSGDCAVDFGAAVADVSLRPVSMTIAAVGSYQLHQLSAVGVRRGIQRVEGFEAGRTVWIPGYTREEVPDVIAGAVTGTPTALAALRAQLDTNGVYDVTLRLEGPLGQWVEVNGYQVGLESEGATSVTVDGIAAISGIRLRPAARWEVDLRNEIPAHLRPRPLPGLQLEVEGVAESTAWRFRPGVVDVDEASIARVLPGVSTIDGTYEWFESESDFFDQWSEHNYRSMSFIHKDAADQETHRYNAFHVLPSAVWLFDPARPYGEAPLVTVELVFAWAERG